MQKKKEKKEKTIVKYEGNTKPGEKKGRKKYFKPHYSCAAL